MKSHPGGIGRGKKKKMKILNMQTRRLVLIGRRRCRPVFKKKKREKKKADRERKEGRSLERRGRVSDQRRRQPLCEKLMFEKGLIKEAGGRSAGAAR